MHCRQDGGAPEPIYWSHYYVFVDEDGNSFFDSNTQYSGDAVMYDAQFQTPGSFISSNFQSDVFSSKKYSGYDVFETDAWSEEIYIIFGNGDVDTLSPSWSPAHLSHFNFFRNEFESFSYHYNGELIETWDFTSRSGLDQQQFLDSIYAGTPYIIEIPKTADPDEFTK